MSKESLMIPMIVLLAAAGFAFGAAGYLTVSQGNSPDQVKDDDYLRAEMTPVNRRISRAVCKLNVNDYQRVKAGRTLIELGDEDDREDVNQTQVVMAAKIQGTQLRQQALALAVSDSFLLMATCCVAFLVVVSFMSRLPTQYRRVTAAPVEAK